ncbi:hypothetical protein [Pigmentiphaga kullae]|uniref:DUF3318 domain-containing protein n=1 Tax=Pigmentiphaga kullae TaxID=151784 RepID=A0A4Q7N7E9_9BURK|nr:hypothetical protein [Pigmentiphaga kullae]RZS77943.1 hypothetical protein EV675_4582 [Pigmentiphaga kullae]
MTGRRRAREAGDIEARKELLLARSSIERMELAAHLHQIKEAVTPGQVLKSVLPSLGGSRGMATAMQAWRFLRRYPIVSSAASMVLARVRLGGVFRLLKLGGGAVAAYQAYKLWRAIKEDRSRPDPR